MSRIGNPYDNAKAESFMKTLKQEEADGRDYRNLDEARAAIGIFTRTSTIAAVRTRPWATARRPCSNKTCNSKRPPRGGRPLLRSQSVPSFVSHHRGAAVQELRAHLWLTHCKLSGNLVYPMLSEGGRDG